MAAPPKPLMVEPGDVVIARDFDRAADVDKKSMKFRKETAFKVANGVMRVIPARVANAGKKKDSKWANSSMARWGFVDLPQEFVCRFR